MGLEPEETQLMYFGNGRYTRVAKPTGKDLTLEYPRRRVPVSGEYYPSAMPGAKFQYSPGPSKGQMVRLLGQIHKVKKAMKKEKEERTGEKTRQYRNQFTNDLSKRGYVDKWGFSV